jgi:hypothetical protein
MCSAYAAGLAMTHRSGGKGAAGAVGSVLTRAAIARGEGPPTPRTQISAPAAPVPLASPVSADASMGTDSVSTGYKRRNKGRFSFNIGGGSASSGSGLNIPQ